MSFTPWVLTDARPFYGGLDLTAWSTKLTVAATVEALDSTTFASGGAKERVGGLFDTQFTIDNFFEQGDASKPDDSLFANLGTNQPMSVGQTTGAVGSLAYLTKVLQVDYKPGGEIGKLMASSTDFSGSQVPARGQFLHPNGTPRTATGNGTAVQLGAVLATQRIYANLHVISVAGTSPTLTVKLQSNVDNTFGSPTDRLTFVLANTISGQCISLVGPVTDTWWRVVYTITGSAGQSFLFAVAAGIARK